VYEGRRCILPNKWRVKFAPYGSQWECPRCGAVWMKPDRCDFLLPPYELESCGKTYPWYIQSLERENLDKEIETP
jgi:predicted RNA-binding Zn-ribbon protein involved in translation (DUF1610 family)